MVTEEEAKKKWCPFVRVHVTDGGQPFVNKPLTDSNPYGEARQDSVFCIASACMMWRAKDDGSGFCALALAGRP